jgi:hypothetical protein
MWVVAGLTALVITLRRKARARAERRAASGDGVPVDQGVSSESPQP